MIRVLNLYDDKETAATIESLLNLDLTNVWVQLIDPSVEEIRAIAEKTNITLNFLTLPEADGYVNLRLDPDLTLINFVIMQDFASPSEVHPIIMASAKNFLVTVSRDADQNIVRTAKERMSKTKIDPPALVTYFLIDEIVSNHFDQLEKLEEQTSKLEEEVVEKTSSETLKRILELKTKLVHVNKTLWYERSLVFNLRKCSDNCMAAKARAMFETTHEDLTRQIDIVETYREIMSDSINVHLSAVSNRTNLSIKSLTVIIFYLTVVTTVTSFPNTIATFFGISRFGNTDIYIIVTALLASTILPVVWLWRKKWLKYRQVVD